MTSPAGSRSSLFFALLTALMPRARRLHGARVPRRGRASSASVERRSTGSSASTRARPGLEGLRPLGPRLHRRSSCVLLYLILRTQALHPLNPQDLTRRPGTSRSTPPSSFVTNTNWQFYGGETTLSNFTQMAGLAVQNFVSAGVGIAVARRRSSAALAARVRHATLGNFWVDLTRALLYVLLPLSIVVGARSCRPRASIQTLRDATRSARSPRRRRSSCSAPTAAASSTSTPRSRSRTRRGSRTSSRCSRS